MLLATGLIFGAVVARADAPEVFQIPGRLQIQRCQISAHGLQDCAITTGTPADPYLQLPISEELVCNQPDGTQTIACQGLWSDHVVQDDAGIDLVAVAIKLTNPQGKSRYQLSLGVAVTGSPVNEMNTVQVYLPTGTLPMALSFESRPLVKANADGTSVSYRAVYVIGDLPQN